MEKDKKQNNLDKPDPETLHTTDPQEHMEGPVSSLVQDARKTVANEKQESKKDKDKKPQ